MLRAALSVAGFSWLMAAASGFAEEQRPSLQYNPFLRPPGMEATTRDQARPDKRWRPELRATLVAGRHSMVNIAGNLMALGEDIDGYRLIEVSEARATFVKNGEKITVLVGGNHASKEDDQG